MARFTRRGLIDGMTGLAMAQAIGGIDKRDRVSAAEVAAAAAESYATAAGESRTLLVWFSRPGENYFYGDRIDLKVGNTRVLAEMIAERISCDLYEIEAADPYPWDYDATVERNSQEMRDDARPEIANPIESIDGYDVIVVGCPIWGVQPPQIMWTFAESFDFRGKRVVPFVTYAVSGLGRTMEVYREAFSGATVEEGLAVLGEEVADATGDVERWLAERGLIETGEG